MRITEVTYGMIRVTRLYENDRAEVTVQLAEGEDATAAMVLARATCDAALTQGRDAGLQEQIKEKLATPQGRRELERFLGR